MLFFASVEERRQSRFFAKKILFLERSGKKEDFFSKTRRA